MRKYFFLIYLLVGFFCVLSIKAQNNKPLKQNIVIKITQTSSYCGGAAPTQDIINSLNTPAPAKDIKIYIRTGKTNNVKKTIVYQGITNDMACVQVQLPPGDYVAVTENKKDKKTYNLYLSRFSKTTKYRSAIDKSCLDKWLTEPLGVFTIVDKQKTDTLTFNIHYPCEWNSVPCSHYSGPLPP